MSDFNFYHSGDLGDIIYSLPTVKTLGGGILHLGNKHTIANNKPEKLITPNVVQNFKSFLYQQDYITDVIFTDNEKVKIDYNLNKFRTFFVDWANKKYSVEEAAKLRQTNLVELTQKEFNISGNLYLDKWLNCNEKVDTLPIVVNRTSRYNNPLFPWKQIIQFIGDKIMFVGHLDEYNDFINKFGKVKFKKALDFNDLFKIINSCSLFIGNQSFCYSLSEGLKKPNIQETDTYMNNCMFFRKDSHITNTVEKINFDIVKNFIIQYI